MIQNLRGMSSVVFVYPSTSYFNPAAGPGTSTQSFRLIAMTDRCCLASSWLLPAVLKRSEISFTLRIVTYLSKYLLLQHDDVVSFHNQAPNAPNCDQLASLNDMNYSYPQFTLDPLVSSIPKCVFAPGA